MTTFACRHIHIDEVQHVAAFRDCSRKTTSVVPRNVYRRCLVRPHLLPKRASPLRSRKRSARTPPSTFLFLPIHLSNSPGPGDPSSRYAGKPPKLKTSDRNRTTGHTIGEELRRRVIAPKADGAPLWALYRVRPQTLSTADLGKILSNFSLWIAPRRACPAGPVADPARRTGATFHPRYLHRGKANGLGTNQVMLGL